MLHTEDDGLSCRWLQAYHPATDNLLTRFDCIMPVPTGRALQEPRQFNHIDRETIEFALEFYDRQIEECKRRAREQPGQQFGVNFYITHQEINQRRYADGYQQIGPQIRVRLPYDFQVQERSKAHEKSIELLKSWLNPDQLAEYSKSDSFVVLGSDTKAHYRLISERSYNIIELDKKHKPTGQKFCVVPRENVALGDQLLAQKIWLETDETRTLKIANKVVRTGDANGNNLLTIGMIAREAVRMFQNSNTYLRQLNADFAEVAGEQEDT